jgi:hypothetical protein
LDREIFTLSSLGVFRAASLHNILPPRRHQNIRARRRIMPTRIAMRVLLGVMVLAASRVATSDASLDDADEPRTVVVLPPVVTVFKSGWTVKPSDEWTDVAQSALDAALHDVIKQSPRFKAVPLPTVTPEERATIEEVGTVVNLVQYQYEGHDTVPVPREFRAGIDRVLGPSLSFLAERSAADYALGLVATQEEQSAGSVATGVLGVAATILFPPVVVLPSTTGNHATMFLLDLRTGELRWLNRRSGLEFSGIDFSDLRDPKSARKVVTALLDLYPESSIPTSATPRAGKLAGRPADEAVLPLAGEFSFQAPAGWYVKSLNERQLQPKEYGVVAATRNGGALDTMQVELRRHGEAFPKSKQKSNRNSTPQQLADQFVEELRASELRELQIIEVSHEAVLAGRPAFRVRFSHRFPALKGGARMEQVTVGTVIPHGLLLASLFAAQLHYFAQALPDFEQSTATIQLAPRKYPHR